MDTNINGTYSLCGKGPDDKGYAVIATLIIPWSPSVVQLPLHKKHQAKIGSLQQDARAPLESAPIHGEMPERLKGLAWKASALAQTSAEGSNPSFSARLQARIT